MKYISILIIIMFLSCKKEEPKVYTVTYTINNDAPAYYLGISTQTTEFTDSIRVPNFTRTETYTYLDTRFGWLCAISNRKGVPSNKSITITYNGVSSTCQDTIWSTLQCQRIP